MSTGTRYLYLVGTERRVSKIKMSVDGKATMIVKVLRPVINIFMPAVGDSMLFAGAF